MTDFLIKPCCEKQVPAIMEIFNDAILNSTASYNYNAFTVETVKAWYTHKKNGNYPVIGLFDDKDTLLGFATYGPFRERPAYKYTVEHSVYVHPNERGKGYGTILLHEIVKRAEEQDYHIMVAGIDASNTISRKLHEKEGFTFCGLIQQTGYKFGRWLDLAFYQLILKTPLHPQQD